MKRKKIREVELEPTVMAALEPVLGPVRPSSAFRRHLFGNLQLAAQHKVTGEPIIDAPAFLNRTYVIAAGAIGLIATTLAVLLYFWEGQKRGSASSASRQA